MHFIPYFLVTSQDALEVAWRTHLSILSAPIQVNPITLPACLTICSKIRFQVAFMYTASTLPSIPLNTFSSTAQSLRSRRLLIALVVTLTAFLTLCSHGSSLQALNHTPSMLLGILPIAVDDTFPACWTICTKLSSQDSSNYKSLNTFNWTPNCTRSRTLNLSDESLPNELLRHPQVPTVSATKYTLSQLLSTLRVPFHVPAKIASNIIPRTLPSILPRTFSSTLPWMPSMTLPVALTGTHSTCLSVCGRVNSQDVLNYSPKQPLKYCSNCTW